MTVPETALVTGASSGIGRDLATLFAAGGSNLVLVARRAAALEELAAALRERCGVEVRVIPRDLSRSDSPGEIHRELEAAGVVVDVVVNNAGFGALGPVARLDRGRQLDMIGVNVTALTALTRLFLPGMIARGRGGVLNVASTAAFQPGPDMAVYYATKAYVLSFTEALAEELRGTGVRASCLAPGPVRTEFGEVSGNARSRLFRYGGMSSEKAARTGYDGFRKGKILVVPGLGNRVGTLAVRLLPRSLVRKIVKFLQSERPGVT